MAAKFKRCYVVKVGDEIIYISESGRKYDAVVTDIPDRPWHDNSRLPTVSLEFRDLRNKLIRKDRVLPQGICSSNRQIYMVK